MCVCIGVCDYRLGVIGVCKQVYIMGVYGCMVVCRCLCVYGLVWVSRLGKADALCFVPQKAACAVINTGRNISKLASATVNNTTKASPPNTGTTSEQWALAYQLEELVPPPDQCDWQNSAVDCSVLKALNNQNISTKGQCRSWDMRWKNKETGI